MIYQQRYLSILRHRIRRPSLKEAFVATAIFSCLLLLLVPFLHKASDDNILETQEKGAPTQTVNYVSSLVVGYPSTSPPYNSTVEFIISPKDPSCIEDPGHLFYYPFAEEADDPDPTIYNCTWLANTRRPNLICDYEIFNTGFENLQPAREVCPVTCDSCYLLHPSAVPTPTPSFSSHPSSEPSVSARPTLLPSTEPSGSPTSIPTQRPTACPEDPDAIFFFRTELEDATKPIFHTCKELSEFKYPENTCKFLTQSWTEEIEEDQKPISINYYYPAKDICRNTCSTCVIESPNPSNGPSISPSRTPSKFPTQNPTEVPTIPGIPSPRRTPNPSITPSKNPSLRPSNSPTGTPKIVEFDLTMTFVKDPNDSAPNEDFNEEPLTEVVTETLMSSFENQKDGNFEVVSRVKSQESFGERRYLRLQSSGSQSQTILSRRSGSNRSRQLQVSGQRVIFLIVVENNSGRSLKSIKNASENTFESEESQRKFLKELRNRDSSFVIYNGVVVSTDEVKPSLTPTPRVATVKKRKAWIIVLSVVLGVSILLVLILLGLLYLFKRKKDEVKKIEGNDKIDTVMPPPPSITDLSIPPDPPKFPPTNSNSDNENAFLISNDSPKQEHNTETSDNGEIEQANSSTTEATGDGESALDSDSGMQPNADSIQPSEPIGPSVGDTSNAQKDRDKNVGMRERGYNSYSEYSSQDDYSSDDSYEDSLSGSDFRYGDNSEESVTRSDESLVSLKCTVHMISGCRDTQTSADVDEVGKFCLPNPLGKSGGACTAALLQTLYDFHGSEKTRSLTCSWAGILLSMRENLRSQGYSQVPQLTSSKPINVNDTFHISNPWYKYGTKRAVLIGINYVGQEGELSGCHNDVIRIKDYLINFQGFEERHITLLMDDGININPTKGRIIRAYRRIVKVSKAGDTVFCHYSGHGGRTKDLDGDESDGLDETLIPMDYQSAGQIIDDDLFKELVQPMSEGVHATCLMDCCHSGTVLDLPYHFTAESDASKGIQRGRAPHSSYREIRQNTQKKPEIIPLPAKNMNKPRVGKVKPSPGTGHEFDDVFRIDHACISPELHLPPMISEGKIAITVPSGPLGFATVDNPTNGIRASEVFAMKQSSILAGKIRNGDRLIALDGIDTSSLTAAEVTKLIISRSSKSRDMVFHRSDRGKPTDMRTIDEGSVSSHGINDYTCKTGTSELTKLIDGVAEHEAVSVISVASEDNESVCSMISC